VRRILACTCDQKKLLLLLCLAIGQLVDLYYYYMVNENKLVCKWKSSDVQQERKWRYLRPVTEGDVGEEDLVHFVPLGFAMGGDELFRSLSGRNLSYWRRNEGNSC
jgi:hypothetical protein